ncbi:histone deacetylase family protein [Williamwhitmania taraxaci]|uniref:Acetoin utilization deacetylase AcuC n=1 Tax=Williamwhitmania taraxaci TaxID=1640674 RepID=A0A1G6IAA3_9BACT|nr:histone deacetylase family protein [Williamwhitmania taraxaci]SDC03472.1 Acetoin utilization deacetylase AcuC [Williamwhitmania taraxaci]
MFRIRTVTSDIYPRDKAAIEQVKEILQSHFATVNKEEFDLIPEQLRNPLKYRFTTKLFVAEDHKGLVKGCAYLYYASDLEFCFLDYIATRREVISGGVGGALYERVREEAKKLKSLGLFFECLPDEPSLCTEASLIPENKKRLRFYENYGARPIINTLYETPVSPNDTCPPHLVYDNIGREEHLLGSQLRMIVRAILERKYAELCPKEYVDTVINSIEPGVVMRRDFRYIKKESVATSNELIIPRQKIILVINDKHQIHHVRERGYVESPVRIGRIHKELLKTELFREIPPESYSEDHIKLVHKASLFNYLKKVCKEIAPKESLYPYVFPIRNAEKPPKNRMMAAGYYCIDTFTPITRDAFFAARRAVDCTLTAADKILENHPIAYALIRPPGHHAESAVFGGFCYFNNCAIAAQMLSEYGRVAILDIDYHHGNGQQQIFYSRKEVLTISIHGHPSFAYPYFSGYDDEKGDGDGLGYNINYPLSENIDGILYRKTLEKALKKINAFAPDYLIVALGLDVAKGDPTGTWSLTAQDFYENGALIGKLKLRTLVVQEGGYKTENIGINAKNFFRGMVDGNPDSGKPNTTKKK